MGQEFFINSQELENKIRQLLPSQGGAGAGFDLSASTQIIPIIDVTPSAEGDQLRGDLQSSLSFADITTFETVNATANPITTTGFWRVFGTSSFLGTGRIYFSLGDASAAEKIFLDHNNAQTTTLSIVPFDFNVFLAAGDFLRVRSLTTNAVSRVTVKQLAALDGTLTVNS